MLSKINKINPSFVFRNFSKSNIKEALEKPRDIEKMDVLIIGAGPAGLSAAIRIKKRCLESGKNLHVTVLEKGSEVGMRKLLFKY